MLLGELDLDATPAVNALGKVDTTFQNTTSGLAKLGTGAGVAFAGIAAAATVLFGAVSGMKEVMDLGGTLSDLSLQTGQAVADLVILREAFTEAGLGADAVAPFFAKFQDAIAGVNEDGKDTAAALEKLGTSAEALRGLSGIEQIEALQKGFGGLADQTKKVAIARDLLGKSGASALSLLGDPGVLDDARRRAGSLAEVMEKNVSNFDKLGDVLGSLKLNSQEFFAGALSQIAPEATTMADKLASIDFEGIGKRFGKLGANIFHFAELIEPAGEAVGLLASMFDAFDQAMKKSGDWVFGVSGADGAKLDAAVKSQQDSDAAKRKSGFARLFDEEQTGGSGGRFGALQRIGLDAGGGLGGRDALLTETQQQTALLREIRSALLITPIQPSAPLFPSI